MSEFQEDMIFKNVNDEDARILLDIMGKKSKKVKIMTKELRQLDPTTFVPDIILELDDEILIIELQSTKVKRKHHKRFHIYVALADYNFDEMRKEVNLCVFTTAEVSKKISHYVNKDNDFKYEIINLADYDSDEIINTITYKIENNIEITGKEIVLFALVPIIEKSGSVEDYIEYIVDTLLDLKDLTPSIKALVLGIEWLIVDKFVTDEQTRNILCDALGDRMTLIHEYARNKENRIIRNQLKSGMKAEVIARTADIPLSRVKSIERTLKMKKS